MATPIIDSITFDPPSIAPGGTCTVTVAVTDPDTQDAVFNFDIENLLGKTVHVDAVLHIKDALTFAASVSVGTLTETGTPGVYTYQAP